MRRLSINRAVLTDPSWWHWTLTVPLLVAHLTGIPHALEAAVACCVIMTAYYLARVRHWRPFPVQVRLAYLVLLVAGTLPWMRWLHGVMAIGTTLMVTIGYCPLERALRLFRFNRTEPLSRAYVGRLVTAPVAGGLLVPGSAPACSVRRVASCAHN